MTTSTPHPDIPPELLTSREGMKLPPLSVRVVKPNLLFCIHQRYSEGVCQGEGEGRGLSRAKRVVGGIIWGDREEEVSDESI